MNRIFSLSKLKRNVTANLLRVILGAPLSFFLTYFIVKKLSVEEFGVWTLAFSFFSYFSFIDLGMTTAVTRFVSFYQAKNKKNQINKVLNTSLLFYFLTGLIFALFLWFLLPFFLKYFLAKSWVDLNTQKILLGGFIFLGFLDFIFSNFLSLLNGLQRMEITSFLDLGKTIIFFILALLFLNQKANLLSLFSAFLITTLIWAFLAIFLAKFIFRSLALGLNFLDKNLFKKLLKFGFQSHFSSLGFLIHTNFDKLLISYFLGTEKVGFLELALKLINQARLLVSSLLSPLLPAATEKIILLKNKVLVFYQRAFKFVLFFSILIFGFLFIFSPLIIKLWLGEGFDLTKNSLQILTFGHLFNLLTGPGSAILLAQNNPKPVMLVSFSAAIANIIFSLLGIYFFGFYGAVLGTTLSLILIDGSFIYLAPKYFKLNNHEK